MVCSGTSPVFGILSIAPFYRNGSDLSTMEFCMSIRTYNKAQINLGKTTHPNGITRSMQMMKQLSLASYGTTYVKALTWDGRRVTQE